MDTTGTEIKTFPLPGLFYDYKKLRSVSIFIPFYAYKTFVCNLNKRTKKHT